MKNLLLIFCCLPAFVLAQQTYVPDDNFEQALIDLGIDIDSIPNDSVTTSNISNVTNLDVSNKFIQNLIGIEDFTDLVVLKCQGNLLTYFLDLSQNTDLNILDFSDNSLDSINLSQNSNLSSLNCQNNFLSSLSLINNAAILNLNCANNLLVSLDVRNGSNTNIFSFKSVP